jgi:SAM-dependent methyltransferase
VRRLVLVKTSTARRQLTATLVSRCKLAVINGRPYRRLRDALLRAHRDNQWVVREDLARRHLSGEGIEIGALTAPLRVPPDVRVRYVDRLDRAGLLREEGPHSVALGLDARSIPEVDVVDDAERLATFGDASVDFVIANHVLEHLEDPIEALENLLRIVRPGGVLLITLPDARHTFDAPRERTTVQHLRRDHEEGPHTSRRAHYEDWARAIEGLPEPQVAARADEFAEQDARHHFHVWELDTFLELVRALGLPCHVVEARAYSIEFAVVLRRSAATSGAVTLQPSAATSRGA